MLKSNFNKAKAFGHALDQDDFLTAASLLSEDCKYLIGEDSLIGPKAICSSYEQNMIEGRKKFDTLEWGVSRIEKITDDSFLVHFTDYLGHKNINYTHRCSQKLGFNNEGLIQNITHIHDEAETLRLKAFYEKVGLK